MKATIYSNVFAEALAAVQSFIEKKTAIPILAAALLECRDGRCCLTGTDLDVAIQMDIPATVHGNGTTVIPVRQLLAALQEFTEPTTLTVSMSGRFTVVQYDDGSIKIPHLDPADFPSLPVEPTAAPLLTIRTPELHSMIARVVHAISVEDSKYTPSGALFDIQVDRLNVIATDGHRMAIATTPLSQGTPYRVLLSRACLKRCLKYLNGETVILSDDSGHSFLRSERRLIIARHLTGQFPNYEKVIPESNGNVLTVNRTQMLRRLTRIAAFADPRSLLVRFHFESTPRMTATDGDSGEAAELIPGTYTGEDMLAAFNHRYLTDYLSASSADSVSIHIKDAASAVEFKSPDFTEIIMPMRA